MERGKLIIAEGNRRRRLKYEEMRSNNELARLEGIRRRKEEQRLLLASEQFVEEFEREEREEEKKHEANLRRLYKKKGKELAEREKKEQHKEREKRQRNLRRTLQIAEKDIVVEETKEAEVVVETPEVAMEEVAMETQPEMAEWKKKKKQNKGRK
ncbi:histone-lysine N-methyltransferase, H3 lysine-79 specific-like, partial [Benincasa hispida]|uniref:histone-lysine N-methyltransferase, H3 lysine-79 specific-like n=1 Tax=Benincasa hispida TaxID=102211 RepID=UPI001902C019